MQQDLLRAAEIDNNIEYFFDNKKAIELRNDVPKRIDSIQQTEE
jgi:hypothetical protein